MAQYKWKTDLLTIQTAPVYVLTSLCMPASLDETEAVLAAGQVSVLLRPSLEIGQLMFPLLCACLSFVLVTVSSQDFENLALSDLKCGETLRGM